MGCFTFTNRLFYYNILYMLTIKQVFEGTIGQEIGLKPGDIILSFDGFDCQDILDYYYFESKEFFTMQVKRGKKVHDIEIEKDEDELLGLSFVDDGLAIKTCHNNCIFCFVQQLPKGMRESLYVKDDDFRQSFLCGNYVTLTNVSDDDIERLLRLKLSPMYISVHCLYGDVREKMLRNRFAGRLYSIMERLDKAGITMHAQIVLVKNVNDGDKLDYTCHQLAKLENLKTLAVVPCGISGHRQGLTEIEDVDGEYSAALIEQVERLNKECEKHFIFAADDFYIRAKRDFPPYKAYGEFEQIENGVGMFASFMHDFEKVSHKSTYRQTFLVVTGVAAYPFISSYAKKCEQLIDGLKVQVIAPENEFFGKTITATGLLTGRDILAKINQTTQDFDCVILPKNMMRETENVFLDNMTLEEFAQKSGKKVMLISPDGASFFKALAGEITE